MNLYAISVSGIEPMTIPITPSFGVPEGKYDDTFDGIDYFVSTWWGSYSGVGNYASTYKKSLRVNDTASLTFQLSETGTVSVFYQTDPAYGVMNILIDGVQMATVNQYSSYQIKNVVWVSNLLDAGVHTITVQHASGGSISLDAIEIVEMGE